MQPMEIEVPMSSGNQFTAPKQLRKALNLVAGDKIKFKFTDTGILVEKAESDAEKTKRIFRELAQLQEEHEKRMTPEQKAFAEMSRGWTANQYRQYLDNTSEHKAYIKEKYGV